jgi:hypothetical protein
MKTNQIKIYLSILLIEGVVALPFLFLIPSKSNNARFLGFSASRIGLALLFSFLLGFLCLLIYRTFIDPTFQNKTILRLDNQLGKRNLLAYILFYLFLLTILGIVIIWYFSSSHVNELVMVLFQRSWSVILWIAALFPQALILLLISYQSIWKKPGFITPTTLVKMFLIFLLFASAIFQWAVLTLHMPYFANINGWFWAFTEQYITHNFGYVIIFTLVTIATALVLWFSHHPKICLFFLLLAGWGLQLSFGYLEGNAFEVLQNQYFISGHRHYAESAVQKNILNSALFNYESVYGKDYYLGTKPPGLLLFYIGSSAIANQIQPEGTVNGRFISLVKFASYVFPILAVLTILILYRVGLFFLEPNNALIPCLLYIIVPSVLLMPLEPDQFLFPLLFIAGICLLVTARWHRSFVLACLAGTLLYISLFFTFAFIALAVMFFLWPLIDYWIEGKNRSFREVITLWAGIALVFLFLTGVSWLILHYNPITRYTVAIANHRSIKDFQPGIHQVFDAILLNNVEFADWIGFPMLLLFFVGSFQVIKNFIAHRTTRMDGFFLAFLLTYIFLNLGGQTRGEVGHLWIFIIPMVVLLSAEGLKIVFEQKRLGVFLLISLQIISVLVVYLFQD